MISMGYPVSTLGGIIHNIIDKHGAGTFVQRVLRPVNKFRNGNMQDKIKIASGSGTKFCSQYLTTGSFGMLLVEMAIATEFEVGGGLSRMSSASIHSPAVKVG